MLQQGIPYIRSEIFFQDDLENFFGKQRAIGCRSDTPAAHEFRYNDNTVKNQFSVGSIRGNVQGFAGTFNEICTEPLLRRRK